MTEHAEQVALIRWATLSSGAFPELRLLHAIPNGGARHVRVGRKLRAEGVKRGVPDLCLPVARGGFHGLYIELKRPRGGRLSAEQRAWIKALREQGYCAEVCAGATEAIKVIKRYLSEGGKNGSG